MGMVGLYRHPTKPDDYNFTGMRKVLENEYRAKAMDDFRLKTCPSLEIALQNIDFQKRVFFALKRWQVNILKRAYESGFNHKS